MVCARFAKLPFLEFGVNKMKRRDFLKIFLIGILSLFSKKVNASRKAEKHLKEAMFWRKID